ncbi:3-dehydroquinate synthase [Legionella adelaidensis]|uniref:3-dehydroquinate synthase n=1 Tax=Legionella adelaidensis TaxID=45056 RepID=A0A0W0R3Y2_9GAMM|nr:3-dehydroquinate synthase [Legionella adelaidensis]KTC65776.1 3-dehydroquinate synthase [Legionella adelaidensis]
MHTLYVELPHHRYPVFISQNCLNANYLLPFIKGSQVLIVTNQTISNLYLSRITNICAGLQCDVIELPDGEKYKNQQSLFSILNVLIENNHHRDTTLIALGGGVIGDITGFAASIYQRGVNYIQIPTTLLAQVDASIGGKTAINHPLAKNSIGSFYQPQAVLIDIDTLSTLPERELRAGLGEVIKYGLLQGGSFLNSFEKELLSQELPYAKIISQCCAIKANFVQKDEREQNERALLNLGHTFAHALETYTDYKRWLHGEAVGIGLYCAALLSYQLGVLAKEYVILVDKLLQIAKLPRRIPTDIDIAKLYHFFFKDKKVKENKLRFVLMREPGLCYLDNTISEACLQRVLMDAVEGD